MPPLWIVKCTSRCISIVPKATIFGVMFYDLKVKHIEQRQLSNIQIVESCNSPLFEYWTVVLAQCA